MWYFRLTVIAILTCNRLLHQRLNTGSLSGEGQYFTFNLNHQ